MQSAQSSRSISEMSFELNTEAYVQLLGALIAESESVQNCPCMGLIPREDNVARHVVECLKGHTQENGGASVTQSNSLDRGG